MTPTQISVPYLRGLRVISRRSSAEADRGDAAAATWTFRGGAEGRNRIPPGRDISTPPWVRVRVADDAPRRRAPAHAAPRRLARARIKQQRDERAHQPSERQERVPPPLRHAFLRRHARREVVRVVVEVRVRRRDALAASRPELRRVHRAEVAAYEDRPQHHRQHEPRVEPLTDGVEKQVIGGLVGVADGVQVRPDLLELVGDPRRYRH